MGGAVSSGQDNDELIDNLKEAEYIKTHEVERVFRIVDRAHYYLDECRESAYKDLAWKSGTLHLSAPCIYSEVMEALELRKGLSFLNLGSGTGYLNTMVGFMIGPYGINHGIELHAENVAYANKKLESFIQTSKKFDDLELCEPQFVVGNCLNLAPENRLYDRVYCGASCPSEQRETIQNMIKVNGILVIPVGDQLLKIQRISETEFVSENVLPVSFASLVLPLKSETSGNLIVLPDVNPLTLQSLCRVVIRDAVRSTFDFNLVVDDKISEMRKAKRVKSTKCFRSEVGRYPLNILPTAQGLMLYAAFDSAEEGEGDDENTRESGVNSIHTLNQQIQHLPSREKSAIVEAGDVDSDLSDMEDDDILISKSKDVNGNKNSSSRMGYHMKSYNDGNTEVEEDIAGKLSFKKVPECSYENKEKNGNLTCTSLRKNSGAEASVVNGADGNSNRYEKILTVISPNKRHDSSFESEEDQASSFNETFDTSELSTRSPAIQVTPFTRVSVSREIRESYSTSADTSETSGFGSLGDDALHLNSQLSVIGSVKDDMEVTSEEEFLPAPSSPASNKRSSRSKSSTGESSVDCDSLTIDSTDAAWADTEDDEDDIRQCKLKKIKSATEHNSSYIKECNSKETEDKVAPQKGPDFSSFLKMKVDALPLPSSLKAFILYYRHDQE